MYIYLVVLCPFDAGVQTDEYQGLGGNDEGDAGVACPCRIEVQNTVFVESVAGPVCQFEGVAVKISVEFTVEELDAVKFPKGLIGEMVAGFFEASFREHRRKEKVEE